MQDLRQKAAAFREMQRPQSQNKAPVEQGQRLATIPRGQGEELRITWAEYQGKPFLSLRVWRQSQDGQWWPQKDKGMSIRVRELADVAEGIAQALDKAMESRRAWEANRQSQGQGGGWPGRGGGSGSGGGGWGRGGQLRPVDEPPPPGDEDGVF